MLRSTLSLLKYTVYVAAFVFLFNIFLTPGYNVIFSYGIVTITSESVLFATSMCLRLFLAVGSFSLLAFIVHPDEALRAMSRFGYKTTTSFSLSTRMYPTIATDSRNIMDAMRARGVEFDEGGTLQEGPVPLPGGDAAADELSGAVRGHIRGDGGPGIRFRQADVLHRHQDNAPGDRDGGLVHRPRWSSRWPCSSWDTDRSTTFRGTGSTRR